MLESFCRLVEMFNELTYSLFIIASYVHRLSVLEGRYLLEMD